MVMMVETLEKVDIPPAAAPAEFTPPTFSGCSYVLMFPCFCGAFLEEASGSPLYRGFRSDGVSGRKNQVNWTIGKRNGRGGAPTPPRAPSGLFWAPWRFS
jgi:hypothetical protein